MESIRFIPEFMDEGTALNLAVKAMSLPLEEVGKARKAVFVGDKDVVPYHYSQQEHAHNDWPDWMKELRQKLRAVTGIYFTGCLINVFERGSNLMGFHSDIEETLAETTPVAVFSAGALRTLSFRNRNETKTFDLPMFNGSLLVMNEDMRQLWQHGVMKDQEVTSLRVSFTFRILNQRRKDGTDERNN